MRLRSDSKAEIAKSGAGTVNRRSRTGADAGAGKRRKGFKNRREIVVMLLVYLAVIFAAGELLYGNYQCSLFFLPAFPLYWNKCRKKKMEEEEYQKTMQFRDAMNSVGASLEAGYSMENAIRAAGEDLGCIYPEDTWIRRELLTISRSIENGVPVEEAMRSFAVSSKLEDAQSFAEIYATARKSGGDLLQIINSAVTVISDKIEVKREIRTILTAKQLECRVMRLIPPGILVYFRVFSPEFLSFLYQGFFGKALMTGLFCFYLFLAGQMDKMIQIEI